MKKQRILVLVMAFSSLLLARTLWAQDVADSVAPEASTEVQQKDDASGGVVTGTKHMVVAANPLASRVGYETLQRGGNAADAMVAVQLILGLVEPQSSGIGGGAFLVFDDQATDKATTFDGRETAPAQADGKMFIGSDGKPMEFYDAVVGGRSVGTPGTVRLLEHVHQKYGKLDWETLFTDAITLARNGFEVSPRLAELVAADQERLSRHPATRDYFLPGGSPVQAGDTLKNPEYADTLELIAKNGSKAFYEGEVAKDIVAAVRSTKDNPGLLEEDDLKNYQVIERPPVCTVYRVHLICGMGPPSSGGIAVSQILGLLEHFPLGEMGPDDPQSWRLIGDASRLVFADRGKYVADSDFVDVPTLALLDHQYLKQRSELLKSEKALTDVQPGELMLPQASWGVGQAIELPSTSHFSIVDGEGNVVSMTTTIENGFGSRVMARGFLLNNEMTDFSFVDEVDGQPVANRIEPGKRPRSSMAPAIVYDMDGELALVVGSPGGSRIIGYVVQAIIAQLDWGMSPQQAAEMPHLVNRFGPYDLEAGTSAEQFKEPLEAMGFEVMVGDLNSGLHLIRRYPDRLEGGADPRREGLVLAE